MKCMNAESAKEQLLVSKLGGPSTTPVNHSYFTRTYLKSSETTV
jgi:hypothetical protein